MLTGRRSGAFKSIIEDSISSPGVTAVASVCPMMDLLAVKACLASAGGKASATADTSEASITLPAGSERLATMYSLLLAVLLVNTEAKTTTPAAPMSRPPRSARELTRRVRWPEMTPAVAELGEGGTEVGGAERRERSKERPSKCRRAEDSAGNHRTRYEIYRETTFLSNSEITLEHERNNRVARNARSM